MTMRRHAREARLAACALCVALGASSLLHAAVAAPMAVVEAAGGIVTDWTGGPAWNGGRVIAAATAELHDQAMRLLADA